MPVDIGIGSVNLRVAIYDSDVYALAALNGYLAWDRRTRVVHRATTPQGLWAHLRRQVAIEFPDVVLMGVEAQSTARSLRRRVARLKSILARGFACRLLSLTSRCDHGRRGRDRRRRCLLAQE